jgi:hypothetical protein
VIAVAPDGTAWDLRRPAELADLLAWGHHRLPAVTVATLVVLLLGTGSERVVTAASELPSTVQRALRERNVAVTKPAADPAGWKFTTLRQDPTGSSLHQVRHWTVTADPFAWSAENMATVAHD